MVERRAHVVPRADARGPEVVVHVLRAHQLIEAARRTEHVGSADDRAGACLQPAVAVGVDEPFQLRRVGAPRILQPCPAPLLPMLDQVEVQLARPAHAALHEAEIQARVAAHHSSQEDAAREGVVRLGEVADMVVGEVRDRRAVGPARAAGVMRHGDAQLLAALPERLVVVRTVERNIVAVPGGFLRVDACCCGGNRPLLVAAKHDGAIAELPDRIVELGDRLLRRARGDDRHRREAAAVWREHLGRHPVVGAGGVPVKLIVRNAVDEEPEARIDDGEVDAELRQALVEERRKKRSGLVARVGRRAPPDRAAQALVLALVPAHPIPLVVPPPERAQLIDRARPARLAQPLQENRDRLDPVAVAVDDRMLKLRADARCRMLHLPSLRLERRSRSAFGPKEIIRRPVTESLGQRARAPTAGS